MLTTIVENMAAAIGSCFLSKKKQLVFTEYAKGAISTLDLIAPSTGIVSSGTTIIKGTWRFDCETGLLGSDSTRIADIWWEQIDSVKRQIMPIGGAGIVNLGQVAFDVVTPSVLQTLSFGSKPIPGNNDATNELKVNDVFVVRTKSGNIAKIKVLQYGYDLRVEWVTYRFAVPYHTVGTGYTMPEDIVATADGVSAYVTERSGSLLKVTLGNANRSAAAVIASGLHAPHQMHLDEEHNQIFVVEFDNPGRLIQIDLITRKQKVLLDGLNNAIGLLVSSDLAYAYISEQSGGGKVTKYSLQGKAHLILATGLTNPFFLVWSDESETSFYVIERDPANRVTLLKTEPASGSAAQVVTGTGMRPSSVACIDASQLLICCDSVIQKADILSGISLPSGLFKGIGHVPWNLITSAGMADTTTQPTYPYQFTKDSPFGGVLSLQFNHALAWLKGVRYYRIMVDSSPRMDTWRDLELNTANGKYEIPAEFKPEEKWGKPGCYAIHQPGKWYMNSDLGLIMNSASVENGKRTFEIEFYTNAGWKLQKQTQKLDVLIDNNRCTAAIDMPAIGGVSATTECGMLEYGNKTDILSIRYVASHPNLQATYSWRVGRAGKGTVPGVAECSVDGPVKHASFIFNKEVGALLGLCPSAAFYAHISVYARAINGFGRQSQYDASTTVAFALTH
jgi:DNA-binding beta-propeller fold protein YncE